MTLAVALLSIGILIILHELGHFLAAKKFGVKVEEFGIGLPPRLLGKKYGETLYSVNALPIGGFVRMEGEEKRSDAPGSFNRKPLWQRFSIVAAGVIVFWVISVVIFAVLGATTGIPSAIGDDEENVAGSQVRIIGISSDSPAEKSGLQFGDTILSIGGQPILKIREVREVSKIHAGQETSIVIQLGSEQISLSLVPRESHPNDELIGVSLTRAGNVKYAWYESPWQGLVRTWHVTSSIFETLGMLVSRLVGGEELPAGTQIAGPGGIVVLLKDIFALGMPWFLTFVATISVYLAIFNTLPIPALDGGRMFFILLEGVRRKPLPEKLERRLILISFLALIPFILWVTVNDILRLL